MSLPKLTRKGLYYLWAINPGRQVEEFAEVWQLDEAEEEFYRGLPESSLASIAKYRELGARELDGMIGTYGRFVKKDNSASDKAELRIAIEVQREKVEMLDFGLRCKT